ncbi:MAG: hypothetical protein GX087_00490 [Desulfobulbaceae bacterium]|nr:hypothetical protein [Desulfobulbaceae bacterium]
MIWHRRLLLCILLVVAVFPAYWLSRNLGNSPDPDELLPADTLLFIHWNNFARFAQDVKQSPIGLQMQRKGFASNLQRLGLDSALANRLDQGIDLLQALGSLPLIQELLQHPGMLALLPNRTPDRDLLGSICDNIIFILPTNESDFRKGVQALIDPDAPVQTEEYQGTSITFTRLRSGYDLYACDIHGFILYAFALDPLRRSLDQAMAHTIGGTQAAHGKKNWLSQHRVLPREEGEFFFYANTRELRAQPLWGPTLLPLWRDILPQQLVVAHTMSGNISSLSTTLRFKREELQAWMHKHQFATPASPPVSASQDEATLLHFWSNWFTPENLRRLAAVIESTELGAPLLAAVHGFFGRGSLSVEDYYQLFSTELGLVVRGERNQNNQFKPLFSLYLKGRDQAAVQESLQTLFSNFPLRKVELEHGAEATTFSMAGGIIQPAFALVGNHLILADNLHMVQQMERQLWQGGEQAVTLTGDDGTSVPARVSLFLFLRNEQIAEGSGPLLRYLASAKNERGIAILTDKQKLFVQQIALPVVATIAKARSSRLVLAAADGEARAVWQFTLD